MRAKEFLSELDGQGRASFTMPGSDKEVTITVPVTINMPTGSEGDAEQQVTSAGVKRLNTTIANPANTNDMPSEPIFIPPLQQQLELQKQQGGKVSPVINQIIADTGPDADPTDGPFAKFEEEEGEPQQSIYYGIDAINGAK